jgi:hypothetical protein
VLTAQEIRTLTTSARLRNFSTCKDGSETCDYSQLTTLEATAESKRNYTACLQGYELCDRSRLTTAKNEMAKKAKSGIRE